MMGGTVVLTTGSVRDELHSPFFGGSPPLGGMLMLVFKRNVYKAYVTYTKWAVALGRNLNHLNIIITIRVLRLPFYKTHVSCKFVLGVIY